jgi:LPXTG-motif cell wall-anchored protein
MKKRFLSVALTLYLVVGLFAIAPPVVHAAVTGTLTVCGQSGLDLASDQSGTGWTWNAGNATLSLSSTYGADPIDFDSTDTVNIVFSGSVKVDNLASNGDAINSKGSLIISGTGTLTLTAKSDGISTDGALTIKSGTVKTTGDSTGLKAKLDINIIGNANVDAFAGKTFDDPNLGAKTYCMFSSNSITINTSGNVNATDNFKEGKGIGALQDVKILNGTITISATYPGSVESGGYGIIVQDGEINISGQSTVLKIDAGFKALVCYAAGKFVNIKGGQTWTTPSGNYADDIINLKDSIKETEDTGADDLICVSKFNHTGGYLNSLDKNKNPLPTFTGKILKHFGKYNGDGTISAHIDRDYNEFVRLIYNVTNKTVDASNYTITEGSTIITLTEAYVKTFAPGNHYFTAEFSDGSTDPILLRITDTGDSEDPDDSEDPGDSDNPSDSVDTGNPGDSGDQGDLVNPDSPSNPGEQGNNDNLGSGSPQTGDSMNPTIMITICGGALILLLALITIRRRMNIC